MLVIIGVVQLREGTGDNGGGPNGCTAAATEISIKDEPVSNCVTIT